MSSLGFTWQTERSTLLCWRDLGAKGCRHFGRKSLIIHYKVCWTTPTCTFRPYTHVHTLHISQHTLTNPNHHIHHLMYHCVSVCLCVCVFPHACICTRVCVCLLCTLTDDGVITVLWNSSYQFSERLYGPLDVDIPCIRLHQPLHLLTRQSAVYIMGNVPEDSFKALMCLNEVLLYYI